MKSVLQAAWLITVAFGNLLDVAVAAFQVVKDPVSWLHSYRKHVPSKYCNTAN